MYFESYKKNECSGCTACMSACPRAAISMQEDDEGFLYPHINKDTCIHCGLCQKVCCWEHPQYVNTAEPITLASVLKDKTERQKSTSGGVFFAIAKWILEQGGVVYGAAFDEKLQLYHIGVDNLEDLQKLRGSKYIQSNLGSIFKEVQSQLEKGRWCYFTGTGCQVAGLKAYLRKDYEKLLCSDVVCHGVPSQKLFNEHIAYMEEKYHDKVVGYQFRDYERGTGCEICFFKKRRPAIKPSYELSPFLFSFMYSYTLRETCYECKYATIPRQGDVTLADFWGVEKYFPDLDRRSGVSLVLINSGKGKNVWKQIEDNCMVEPTQKEDAVDSNHNITRTAERPAYRDSAFKEIRENGYAKIANEKFRSPRYYQLLVEKKIQRVPGLLKVVDALRRIKRRVL